MTMPKGFLHDEVQNIYAVFDSKMELRGKFVRLGRSDNALKDLKLARHGHERKRLHIAAVPINRHRRLETTNWLIER